MLQMKKIPLLIRLLTILSVILLTHTTVHPQESKDEYYSKGVAYAVAGKFAEAEKEFENALRLDPFLFYASSSRLVVQDAMYGKIKKETAIAIFKGIDLTNRDKISEALAEFGTAITLNPAYPLTYNERGIVYGLNGQQEKAIADFTTAIRLSPRYDYAYNNRAHAYVKLERYDKAIEDFSKAIEINPHYAIAYYNRGWLLGAKMSEYESAIADLTKAIEINPKFDNAYLTRGVCRMYQDKHDEALLDFNMALEINPANISALWNKAVCLDELGRKYEALAVYQNVVARAPAALEYVSEAKKRIAELER
jgi:tetratricopeptide (TPR) repeat protein